MKKGKTTRNSPNLRFPEFLEQWEEKMLGEIAKKSLLKNKNNEVNVVFSNSATRGIVMQNDYFDKDIANVNNLSGYYIIKPFDFVYNPRISSQAEVGAMNMNDLEQEGLVSPLYTVFRIIDDNINKNFLNHFFKSKFWHTYMKSIANYGARDDRMNIKDNDFFNLPIHFPTLAEQTKIASFLSKLD
ncbi:restriction endonuclease subunit S, partial [Capnocytophaga sp.]|uniref:restriction endonuclease subunit S n=1 Tax=Capnocytophaga sp. TaxID=44737 RepID=UPI0026DCAA0A